MLGQRIFGIALGYEDVVDHDELRHDPIMAVLAGKLVARDKNCARVAGKSAVELGGLDQRIRHGDAIAAGIGAGEEVVLPAVEDKR
jgi:hypothetical protein